MADAVMRSWVVALLLLAPAAGAAPVDVYLHLDGGSDMPANTQQPEGERVARDGIVNHSGCVPAPGANLAGQSRHTWYAFGTPSYVQYTIDEDGKPRYHPERGLGMDVLIDDNFQPTMTWHMAATGPTQQTDGLAQVVPDVIVRVQVRASDDLSVGNQAFDAGPLVASGEVGPVTLRPGVVHEGVSEHDSGGLKVYAFHVPLELHNNTIAQTDGYNIRIDAMMDNPLCTDRDGYIMPDLVSPYQGPGLWNHLRLGVLNPIQLEAMHLQLVGQEMVIHVAGQSPFGGQDVAAGSWLDITGPSLLPATRLSLEDEYHGHGIPPAKGTWTINLTEAAHGLYNIRIAVSNLQGTANATATATFEVGEHGTRICQPVEHGQACTLHAAQRAEIPALPLVWLLGALVLLRRR